MRKITAKGGPLNGKTFLIPDNASTFTNTADTTGHYRVNTKTATWHEDTGKGVPISTS